MPSRAPLYQFVIKYKSGAEFLYSYEPNLSEEQALEISALIDALVTSIRFDGKLIYPKRVNEYRIFLTENSFPHRSEYLYESYPEGYKGDFGGKEVTIEISLKARPRVRALVQGRIIAFLSASFSDEIDWLISWFMKMIDSIDIEVNWLKEKYQARPTEEKIKENIHISNCFIQIITTNVYEEGKEAGWLGHEIAWARESTPNGNIAIFVEEGAEATGLAREVADNLYFNPNNLAEDAPKIVQYLNDLKKRILS